MLNELLDLAKTGGRIAREHFGALRGKDVVAKRPRDYVTHVDTLVEETLVRRIRARFPDHQVLGEEDAAGTGGSAPEPHRPLWIIDPIDGTTNFMRGIPAFAVSIAFCEAIRAGDGRHEPRFGIVYDPLRDEAFTAEAGAGLWLNGERAWTTGCTALESALLATALPFRFPATMDDMAAVIVALQKRCDDQRRGGSAALDLAYTAVGRLDGYYELGIYPWDTAAGELLVRCGGGVATDWKGRSAGILGRRAIVAGASTDLHRTLLDAVSPLVGHLVRPELAAVAS
jgi:myo-inositol-1(or 4)-monophosphatase